jgi:PIN domain nuclease of toxin-antitoxin system
MILLDTHVLIWSVSAPRELSRFAADAIRRNKKSDGVAISAITLWELSRLLASDRIRAYGTVEASVSLLTREVIIMPITVEIAALAAQFGPDYPGDPADRLIGATAKVAGVALVTKDEKLRRAKFLETIW